MVSTTQQETVATKKAPSAKNSSSERPVRVVDGLSNPSRLTATNPATGEVIGSVDCIDIAKMPEVFSAARKAQEIWASFDFETRRTHILAIRDYMIEQAESISKVVALSTGKTLSDAFQTEVLPCILGVDWYAKKAKKHLRQRKINPSNVLFANKPSYVLRIPYGVVGVISPWNYPLAIPFGEIIMGLMAGNAIVYRPAEETPLVAEEIRKIIESGQLPEGLCQLTMGRGPEISSAWFENKVDKLFFTGSVNVGKQLMRQAADTLTPLSLELGGNDAMIVLEDANLERAANGALWAGFQNSGQSCAGVERIYVQESVAETFKELLIVKTNQLRQGIDRGNFDTDIGSMTVARQLDVVKRHVEDALNKGARIIAQAKIRDKEGKNFYPATVLDNVDHTMDVMKFETFGPVVGVMTFATDDEAIDLANDSDLGLTSSVWTMNSDRGKQMAARLQTGVTTINDHLFTHGMSELPWLGWKNSGIGATHSHMGLEEMTRTKVVNYDLAPNLNANVWWFPVRSIKTESLFKSPTLLFGKNLKVRTDIFRQLVPRLLRDPLLKEKLAFTFKFYEKKGVKEVQKKYKEISHHKEE
jgi:succinate-semialdehyde dehydrogenase/glutarate-semialdehyde dehydrogenase